MTAPPALHPLSKAAVVAGIGALIVGAASVAGPTVGGVSPAPSASSVGPPALAAMPCPPRTVPDGAQCVPLPDPNALLDTPTQPAERRDHRQPGRGLVTYDHLPRRPDRPEDYAAYASPVGAKPTILSGYDLDRPGVEQRRAGDIVGHGGVDYAAARGDAVRLVLLTGQEGLTEVKYVGPLFGNTVVTGHAVREGKELRDYLVLYAHLQNPAPGLKVGDAIRAGDVVGFAGDTGSEGNVHLHLEARRVRRGVDLSALSAPRWLDQALTIPCDPRNVLSLDRAQ